MVNIILLSDYLNPSIITSSNNTFHFLGSVMFYSSILFFYRLLAIVILVTPITLNVIFVGDFIMSLLYIPLLTLLLGAIFIYIDKQISRLLTSIKLMISNNEHAIKVRKQSKKNTVITRG